METVSKFTLNPLATCFIPSSTKYQTTSCAIFSVPIYSTFVNEHIRTKTKQLPIITNKQNTEYLHIMKVQSNPVTEKTLYPFVTIEEVMETLSDTVNEEVVAEEPFSTTKKVLSNVNDVSRKTLAKKNDERISKKISKKRKGSEDFSLTNLDTLAILPIFRFGKLLKGGTKTLWMLLPFAMRSLLVLEFFYRMELRTVSINLTVTSHLCSVLKPKFNTITCSKRAKKTKINRKVKRDKCHCPPMFGWIAPLQIFDNPLKLSDSCGKDYVHTSCYNVSSSGFEHSFDKFNINDGAITLEQYSSELKAIIKDVCDSLSSYDQSTEHHNLISKARKRPVWETKQESEVHFGLDIIDDGIHPLLQESSAVDSEATDLSSIQAILEAAFSGHENSSRQEILSSQSVCNPPCSVWCNKVPTPAKDAYKRFIKKMDSGVRHKVTDVKVSKPLYKRCFSADDTPKISDKIPFLSASSVESRERLLLLHKDPLSFVKQSSISVLKDVSSRSKSRSSVVSGQNATKENTNESGSDKWSLYDGADSMWQPLPECIPLSDSAQKQSLRKARDIRRQKSIC